jgi:beta-glucosidase
MCRNILLVKYQLGLFEDPFRYGGVERAQKSIYKPEHLEFARKVARESMVLLKNDEEVLPLKNGSRIALIGPYVADGGAMLGSWTGCGERDKAVTIEKGMKSRFSGNVQVVKGCGPFEEIEGGIDEAVKAARRADVAVLTLGYPGALSGEAASMTSVELPQVQKELLEAVRKTGTPVVVLLVTGRPMALESVEPMMDGLLVVWHPGSEGGNAVADLLSGDYSPSGHLAMTFPRCDGQIPIRYNHKATGRPTERTQGVLSLDNMHKYYKSCYLFTPNTPLYPFGYGLSYTQFSYDSLEVVNPLVAMGEDVVIKARVTNTGKKDGATVAQLYVHDMVASTTRPVRELKGFKRVELKAGESAELEFILKPSDLAFCREDMKFAVEPGDFMVWVGDDCNASAEGRFTIK